uniref:Metallo-beta-lactamase domain-containing protein n=1 Tax=Magnetococcus massalia (strain MO-1) TaxID=451514 RepID=A0A1S7LCQ9_MAGMO|nr:conserved protein of unknown function[Include Beta-lactamase domain] [Candidatus Magnetococcus massalia]
MRGWVLGSGTGIPLPHRNPAGYVVQGDGGWLAMLDCGSGNVWRLTALGHAIVELDLLLISHTHPDHVGDLLTLFHAFHLPGLERRKPLNLVGPAGFEAFLSEIIFKQTRPPKGFPLQTHELPMEAGFRWQFADLVVESAPMLHVPGKPAVGYRLEADGQAWVYSGDADASAELVALSRDADLAIYDCSCLEEGNFPGHMSALQCGRVAQQAGVKQLVLSHLYPLIYDRPDSMRLEEARQVYAGLLALAEDRLPLPLRYPG